MQALPFDRIAKQYDRVNDVLSFGLHRAWKEELVNALLKEHGVLPEHVLDVATGTGDVAARFHKKGSRHVVGLDPSSHMLALARQRHGTTIEWKLGSSETLSLPTASIDLISCAFGVRNFQNRRQAFAEWRRVLRPGGRIGIIEIHPVPDIALLKPIDWYWRRVVPPIGRLFGDEPAYEYLRDSAGSFLTPQALAGELETEGFRKLSLSPLFACGMVSFGLFQRDGIYHQPNRGRTGLL
ncbi:MAG: ubiquinone/menaquinone biosynthesis methyltransferase [Bdellovibrionales bacterium]|nr:ubiquinone/menaquinone biosynthesis methyltransferase [Bdellovibrionales bacterium]